jgi:hypothetical protein
MLVICCIKYGVISDYFSFLFKGTGNEARRVHGRKFQVGGVNKLFSLRLGDTVTGP